MLSKIFCTELSSFEFKVNYNKYLHDLTNYFLIDVLIDICIKAELDPDYWNKLSESSLREALNQQKIQKKAKNVIIFLGDGMGITTTTSARILKGQLLNNSGEESTLSFDNFPYISLIKVIILNFMSIPIDIILQITNYLLFL
jgi:hypothetical protein